MLLEVCVDSPEGLAAAARGGADRLELCSALALGGLTPTRTLMARAYAAQMPFVAMIRPREGDFIYTPEEIAHMQADIDDALERGAKGIVLGASGPDGRLDSKVLKSLVKDLPAGSDIVLHRAVDLAPDPIEAVDTALALGFTRILTSGGARTAAEGLGRIRNMFDRAAGRLTVMPGSGITAANVAAMLALLPVDEVHASCAVPLPQSPRAVAVGLCAAERRETAEAQVRALRRALDQFVPPPE